MTELVKDNTWLIKRRAWQPLKFGNNSELQKKIHEYFESCYEVQWKEKDWRDENWYRKKVKWVYKKVPYKEKVMVKVPTVSELAYYLDTNRTTLINYEKKDEYFNTIKRAKQFIEAVNEKWLIDWTLNPTWVIFNLKNNYWWIDKTEVDSTNKNLNMNVVVWLPKE